MDKPKKWMYHKTLAQKGKVVLVEDVKKLESEGWVDSPAKFKGAVVNIPTSLELPASDKKAELIDPPANIAVMTKDEINAFTNEHGLAPIDNRKSEDKMRVMLVDAIEAYNRG